ncbi:CP family cyanate transporter-like MFS transporter [Actinomadura pelletieri DSM 43383]|uniref:CP family cyanate transporter-like MFS transporter n=1 Tax=Actinomadura pelletieri DSM 43383 TaxID=1120940 RepID=A0A495QH05_9ACTN|nr:MFS transporter [Actinomadura pelletieri]RKS71186.1 CP family cyanate transporter-like MFS transporter [Actinomadura pelletieri DSM 43383]
MTPPKHRRAGTVGALLLIVLVAINLRPAIAMVGPVLTEISDDFGLSGTAAGALTTLPLAFFGSYGLLAAFLRRAPRSETLLVTAMGLLVTGLLLRLLGAPFPLFAGSLIAGIAISIGNIAMPAVIKRDHPGRITTVTAVYTLALSGGAAVSSGLAVPIEDWFDASWRLPLGLLAVPAALAGLIWLPKARRAAHAARSAPPVAPSREVAALVWRSRLAWQVTAFMGIQSLLAYVTFGWLPTICQDRGLDESAAGYVLALTAAVQAVGSLAVPVLAGRSRDQRPLVVAAVTLTLVGFAGMGWAPIGSAWIWAVVLGIGQGFGFTTALAFIGLRAHDTRVAAQLSGMAQGVGYVIAAAGPLTLGALHDATGGWSVPMAVVVLISAILALPGLAAGRTRTIGEPTPPAPKRINSAFSGHIPK